LRPLRFTIEDTLESPEQKFAKIFKCALIGFAGICGIANSRVLAAILGAFDHRTE
jgi:hypothetical protein